MMETDIVKLLLQCVERERAKAPPLRDEQMVAVVQQAVGAIRWLRERVARLEGLA